MIQDSELEPLRRWLDCDMSPAGVVALIAHPRFAEAARTLNVAKVEAAADPAMAALARDAGHFVAAAIVFSLHQESGHGGAGITLPRLKTACLETRFMSPGRARAMLGYLQHAGFITMQSPRAGKTPAVYAPTQRFNDAWCDRMRRGLQAAALLQPAASLLLDRMDDQAVAIAFAQRRGDSIRAGLGRATGHDLPFVRIFNHRLGGGRALALLLSRDAGDLPLAAASVPWSLAEMVEHCGISRIQAKRLFDDALAEGLVTIEGDRLAWTEVSRQFILYRSAFEFASLLGTAAATILALPEMFPVTHGQEVFLRPS